jgi:hypothetical protein
LRLALPAEWSRTRQPDLYKISAAMGLVVTVTFGMVVWIVLWALGVTGFDAFLLTSVIILCGATARIAVRYLPGRRQ